MMNLCNYDPPTTTIKILKFKKYYIKGYIEIGMFRVLEIYFFLHKRTFTRVRNIQA